MPPQPLVRSASRPLWAQLRDDLMARLGAGEFAAAFPGELALTAEYGVSRHTVREALRRLRADGLVAADRVWLPAALAAPLLDADFTHTALYEELARRCGLRLHGGWERITAVSPTSAERALLGIDTGTPWSAVTCSASPPSSPRARATASTSPRRHRPPCGCNRPKEANHGRDPDDRHVQPR